MSLTYWSSKVASKKVTRQPDAQFLYDLGRLPSLIIEVVWTQTTEKLQELSCDYILSSNARIRTVIGFDVDPSAGKVATVSIWRAVYKEGNIAVTCDSTVRELRLSPSRSLIRPLHLGGSQRIWSQEPRPAGRTALDPRRFCIPPQPRRIPGPRFCRHLHPRR